MTENKIKPLEWEHRIFFDGIEEWIAEPIPCLLKYVIIKGKGQHDYSIYLNSDPCSYADDLNQAKHLAQADFEDNIGGCLS